ncbi:MAG TPA: hypothetical protein VFZ70_06985 [Euzebyales bacterium]
MPTPIADDIANPLLQTWDELDRWLVAEARELARLRLEPETTAYVLHDGMTTLLIRTPPLCAADAEPIGAALAHMIHPLRPDQVVVTYPAATVLADGAPVDLMHAMAGQRGGTWRHVQVPLPYLRPHTGIALTALPTPDPWTAPVHAVFEDEAPPPPDLSKVHHTDAEFTVAVNPDGPAAGLASRWPSMAGGRG